MKHPNLKTEKDYKFLQLFILDPNLKFSTQTQMVDKFNALYPEISISKSFVQRRCTEYEITKPQGGTYYELNEKYTQLAQAKKISDTLADIDFATLDITFNPDYIVLKPKDRWSLAKISHHLLNSLDFNDNIIDILTLNTSLLVFCKDKTRLQKQLSDLASMNI